MESPRRPALVAIACSLATACGLSQDLGLPSDGPPDAVASGMDASVARDGGDTCIPVTELCNAADDDCDGAIDEAFDLATDPLHCGACDTACPTAGGFAACAASTCSIVCDDAHEDCDGEVSNGCEADLGSADTCGDCGVECEMGSARVCRPAVGGGFECARDCGGLTDCDGSCVDIQTDPANCGACSAACFADPHGSLSCNGGTCQVDDCGDNRDDCNGDASDGCEQPLGTDAHCGMCGDACGAGSYCDRFSCVVMPACGTPTCSGAGSTCSLSCGSFRITCTGGSCSCVSPSGLSTCATLFSGTACTPCTQALRSPCCSS